MPESTANLTSNLTALLGSAKDPAGDNGILTSFKSQNSNDNAFSRELSRASEHRRSQSNRDTDNEPSRQFDQTTNPADAARPSKRSQHDSQTNEPKHTQRSNDAQKSSEGSIENAESGVSTDIDTKQTSSPENEVTQQAKNTPSALIDAQTGKEDVQGRVNDNATRTLSELQLQESTDNVVTPVNAGSAAPQENESSLIQVANASNENKQSTSVDAEKTINSSGKATELESTVGKSFSPMTGQVVGKVNADLSQSVDPKSSDKVPVVDTTSVIAKNGSSNSDATVSELVSPGDKLQARVKTTDNALPVKAGDKSNNTVSPSDLANRLHPNQLANRSPAVVQQATDATSVTTLATQSTLPDEMPAASASLQASILGMRESREMKDASARPLPGSQTHALNQPESDLLGSRPSPSEAMPLPREVSGLQELDAEALAAQVNNGLLRSKAMQKSGLAQIAASQLAASAQMTDNVQSNSNTQLSDSSPVIQTTPFSSAVSTSRVDSLLASTTTGPLNVPLLSTTGSESLANNVRWMVKEGVQVANINVTPSGMGPISVKVGIENDQMNVSIIAAQGGTRDALDAMLPKLRDQLMSQGHESVKVEISDGRSEQSRGQGQNTAQDRQSFDDKFAGSADSGQSEHNQQGESEQETQYSPGSDSGERILSDAERDLAMQLQRLSAEPGSTSGAIQHGYDLYV